MKQKVKLLIFTFLLLGNISAQDFRLNGTIDGFDGQNMMLFTFKNDSINSADTAIIQNGKFCFDGKEYLEDFAMLSIGNYPDTVLYFELLLEKGNIELSWQQKRVSGTPLNDLYQSYIDSSRIYSNRIKSLYFGKESNADIEPGSEIEEAYKEYGLYTVNFKKQNISNVVGKKLFRDQAHILFSESIAYPDNNEDFYQIYNAADELYKQEPWIAEFIIGLENTQKIMKSRHVMLGKMYTDIELQTIDDRTVRLSDFVGKSDYLLLDFWASWCGACIADMPHLKKVYEKYKDKGFEVVGISMDTSKKAWQNALNRIDIPWINLSDLKGMVNSEHPLVKAYALNGLPYALLLNKKGEVIGVNLYGQTLDVKLESLLKEY